MVKMLQWGGIAVICQKEGGKIASSILVEVIF